MRSSKRTLKQFVDTNKDIIWVLTLSGGMRALVCILTNNVPGDADDRALIAGAWAAAPHLIRTGIWLPLHFYATGLLTFVFGNPITAGKVLSFLTGTLTTIPLFRLVQRLFDRQTALIAALYFAFFGNHVGLSSEVMSEAPFVLVAIWGLDVFFSEFHADVPRLNRFLISGMLIGVAGGFRQEGWQLAGILGAYLVFAPKVRRYAISFTVVGLSSYVLWTLLQVTAGYDLLFAIGIVGHAKSYEALYAQFSPQENVLRWVWIFVQSPGPVLSVLAFSGMYLALRRRANRDLAIVAALLLSPYVILSLVKPEWAPQSRYVVLFTTLIIPYAAAATILIAKRGYALRLVVSVVLIITILSQAIAYHRKSRLFLPCQDYDANDIAAWKWLSANVEPTSEVIVEDVDWRGPSIIVHAGLYSHNNHIFFSFDKPEVLERLLAADSSTKLIVLHSPLSKWAFLKLLNATTIFQNNDYKILRVVPTF